MVLKIKVVKTVNTSKIRGKQTFIIKIKWFRHP